MFCLRGHCFLFCISLFPNVVTPQAELKHAVLCKKLQKYIRGAECFSNFVHWHLDNAVWELI